MTALDGYELTTSSDASGAHTTLYVHTETTEEAFVRASNDKADAAMRAGLRGDTALCPLRQN